MSKKEQTEKLKVLELSEHYGYKELMQEVGYMACHILNLWVKFMQMELN